LAESQAAAGKRAIEEKVPKNDNSDTPCVNDQSLLLLLSSLVNFERNGQGYSLNILVGNFPEAASALSFF
jgi:hypothetical protein